MEFLSDIFFSEKYCLYRNIAAVFGALLIGRVVIRMLCDLLSGFRAFFLAPLGIGKLNLRKYGSWAVVTGASEGIGRAYALELAKRGLNVVLMSRSEEKLDKVASEIKKFGCESRVIPVDFSDGFNIYQGLADKLNDLDIGVLVNNVGFSYEYPDILGNVPAERLFKMVQINCHPVVQMTRILLGRMVSRGGGVIINISSAASGFVLPQLSGYSATKIFVDYISEGLHKEYGSKGIIVQNVTPFVVATAMSRVKRTNFFKVSSAAYAKAALATVGIQKKTFGCFSHALQGYIMHSIPAHILDHFMNGLSDKTREKYLRNKSKSN